MNTGTAKFDKFEGNRILLKQKAKAFLASVYGEVGFWIPKMPDDFQLYVAAGPYSLGKRHIEMVNGRKISTGDKWGGKYRVATQIFEYFDVGVELTHDSLFHTRVQGYASISLPLGPSRLYRGLKKRQKSDQCASSKRFRQKMTQPVQRNEIISIYKLGDGSGIDVPATDAQGNIIECIFRLQQVEMEPSKILSRL